MADGDTVLDVEVSPRKVEYFFAPDNLQTRGGLPEKIAFYQPTAGHELSRDAVFAVRTNEPYKDFKAAMEGERYYVRNAIFQANELYFYRVLGKNPIIIMKDFSPKHIFGNRPRAVDAALDRSITFSATKGMRQIELDGSKIVQDCRLFRITGPEADVTKFINEAPKSTFVTVKKSHIQGAAVAHAYLTDAQQQEAKKHVLVEFVSNITTSEFSDFQLTLRAAKPRTVPLEDIFNTGIALQATGANVHLRAAETLRVTFPEKVTADTYHMLTASLNQLKVFTDTPINVWTAGRSQEQKRAESHGVANAKRDGLQLAVLAADSTPHPSHFYEVCNALKAHFIEFSNAKYTLTPMSCLIALPSDHSDPQITEPFTTGGLEEITWQVTLLGGRRPK